ncbi:beta-galactosidase trimerization domain-containing protein [Nonomuraea sp. K274]|uniref:Beta-galactosidase trimerization domain-containing protein n=1 Tax=Nonomuraea cypriaca TaxID=1187855 RepID=A0A931AH32_9ACTN|nr:alpha-amylase family protein [Nonomuraea cypriaca]MBF8191848.1 beta-galactosidase trimerization domain-containing protein [Nonomuraea cypriaca]
MSWWREPFRMFQTNLREVDAGLDVERVLDYIEEFGANAWLISVGGILSNYPTGLDFQTPNPRLAERPSGDLVGDAVAAARRRGVRVLARMDFSKIDHRRAEEHPEWCFAAPDGTPQVYNGLTSVCPSGDYYQVKLFEVIGEVLDRYEIDGFFLNWMSFNEVDYSRRYRGVCHCLACVRRFAQRTGGEELPADRDSPGYLRWRRFAHETLEDLNARVRAEIAARRPEAALILGEHADIVFHEANNAVGRPLWHHRTSEHVSAAKSYRPGVPVLVNSVGFVDMPYRMAGEEPYHFAQYLLQAISRGAVPSTYIMGTPDDSPYECLGIGGEITRFHRDHAGAYRGLVSEARTLLVRPDPLKTGDVRAATSEFQGLYLALLERHVPFDVLPEDKLPVTDLSRYRLIVLPDLGTPQSPGTLDAYAEAGGTVLATGSSGFDADEVRLACLPAVRRLASRETEEATRSLHVRGDTGLLPVIGAFHVVEPAEKAETGVFALSRARYGPPEKCHGHRETGHPGWLSAPYGKGTGVLMPWTVGRGYRETGLSAHRDLFADRALAACPDLAVETDLPEQVEIVPARAGEARVIHLLNRSGDADQRFRRPLPIGESWLTLPWPGEWHVRALRAGRDLEVSDGRVRLPELGLFEVLLIADCQTSIHDLLTVRSDK